MNKQFTASEVHRLSNRIPRSNDEIADAQEALRAFAYMLEAREMAMPVRQFRVVPKGSTWTDVKDDEIWAAVTAHPESYETRVLYTHSTQAQPPAARVPDADTIKRVARAIYAHVFTMSIPRMGIRTASFEEVWVVPAERDRMIEQAKAAIAAQENPNG